MPLVEKNLLPLGNENYKVINKSTKLLQYCYYCDLKFLFVQESKLFYRWGLKSFLSLEWSFHSVFKNYHFFSLYRALGSGDCGACFFLFFVSVPDCSYQLHLYVITSQSQSSVPTANSHPASIWLVWLQTNSEFCSKVEFWLVKNFKVAPVEVIAL